MKLKTLFWSVSLALSAPSAFAVTSTIQSATSLNSYPTYLEGEVYKGGDVVSRDGVLYRCKTGATAGWCSGAAWAYAPGTGTAWQQAWESVTEADLQQPQPPSDHPQYVEGHPYQSGDIVFNVGQHYRCKPGPSVPWCSGVAWAYAPGTGSAWDQAWELVPDSDIEPPIEPEHYTLNVAVSGQGSVTPRNVSVAAGTDYMFQVTAAQGHALKTIVGCEGELNGNVYKVTNVQQDCEIEAQFASSVDLAIERDDHTYASESELLSAMREELHRLGSQHDDNIDMLLANLPSSMSWTPSKVSVSVDRYNPEMSFPVLMSNVDHSGQDASKTLMTLSEKAGHRFGFVGSNLFLSGGNNDTDAVVKNTLAWLTQQSLSPESTLSIAISQVASGHYRDIKNWLETHLPNATINTLESCDYDQMNACVEDMDADLVIFGAFDGKKKGAEQTDRELEKLIAKKIPIFVSFAFSHGKQPMMASTLQYGEFTYASNYNLGAKLDNFSVDELKATLKTRPAPLLALARYVDDLETGEFDPQLTLLCGNFLTCVNDASTALNTSDFGVGTQWLRQSVIQLDQAGIDVFSLDTHRLLKIALLLADKYRMGIDYPMTTADVTEWQKASFADSIVSYARVNNVAQPDLGDFVLDRSQLEIGKGTPYAKPDTVTERKAFSVPFNNQWTATGWYALPGEAFTLTRHDDAGHDVQVVLNFRRSNANRMMDTKKYLAPQGVSEQAYVQRRLTLKTGEAVTMSTPYGGPIYLSFINGNGELAAEVTASGVAQHPYIDDINSPEQLARFEQMLNETELPQVDVKTEGYEQHLRKDRFLDGINDTYPTIAALLNASREEHIDVLYARAGFKVPGKKLDESFTPTFLNICTSLFGADCLDDSLHTRPFIQHANYDQNAHCGSGCGGNPYDSGSPLSPRGWLDNHELGHGLQKREIDLHYVEEENKNNWKSYQRRSGESQNNVFAFNQRWNYHFVTDQSTEVIPTPYDDKDLFFAFMSDVNDVTNAEGERVVLRGNCSLYANPEGRDRYTASWSINKDAHYPLHIYIQMILQAHKLEMPNGAVLENGFDIFTLLHQHVRMFDRHAVDEKSWLANRDRLGFSEFDYQGNALYGGQKVSYMPGNDFLLISLNYMTQRDWSALFDLAGLRYSDLAKTQAAMHVTKAPMPLGMYVQGKQYPGVNLSDDLIFLPLDHNDKSTRWPLDNTSPVDCQ